MQKSMKSSSALMALLGTKCPRCRKGNMFLYQTFQLGKFSKMNRSCPYCDADFEPEPGFYFGAMYFSYAINIAIIISFFVATLVLYRPDELWVYLVAVLVPTLLVFPFNFRISRALMLHLFGGHKYDPHIGEKQAQ